MSCILTEIFLFLFSGGSGSSSSVEQEIEHKCEMCGTEFVTATSLKIHRLKCDKQKKMACEFCLDEFRSETSLKMHKLICVKVTKNPDDSSKDVDNQNNDNSNSNNDSSSNGSNSNSNDINHTTEYLIRIMARSYASRQAAGPPTVLTHSINCLKQVFNGSSGLF